MGCWMGGWAGGWMLVIEGLDDVEVEEKKDMVM